jgi:hypothetical protein
MHGLKVRAPYKYRKVYAGIPLMPFPEEERQSLTQVRRRLFVSDEAGCVNDAQKEAAIFCVFHSAYAHAKHRCTMTLVCSCEFRSDVCKIVNVGQSTAPSRSYLFHQTWDSRMLSLSHFLPTPRTPH